MNEAEIDFSDNGGGLEPELNMKVMIISGDEFKASVERFIFNVSDGSFAQRGFGFEYLVLDGRVEGHGMDK